MIDDFGWGYFVLGLVTWQILKMFAMSFNQYLKDRRAMRFIRLVNINFPDRQSVTFVSTDSSDRRAFKEMEKELKELYRLTEDQLRRET